jgi:hypothetical protein
MIWKPETGSEGPRQRTPWREPRGAPTREHAVKPAEPGSRSNSLSSVTRSCRGCLASARRRLAPSPSIACPPHALSSSALLRACSRRRVARCQSCRRAEEQTDPGAGARGSAAGGHERTVPATDMGETCTDRQPATSSVPIRTNPHLFAASNLHGRMLTAIAVLRYRVLKRIQQGQHRPFRIAISRSSLGQCGRARWPACLQLAHSHTVPRLASITVRTCVSAPD